MVYTILVPVRKMFRFEGFITEEHLESAVKLTLLTSTIVFYAYAIEFFVAWYSGNPTSGLSLKNVLSVHTLSTSGQWFFVTVYSR